MSGNFASDQSREMDAEGIPDLEPPINQDEGAVGDAADQANEGRLLEPGPEDVDVLDDEKDAVATIVDEEEGAQSAEESAMHITDSP